jgi:hypothetical protein
MCIHVCIHVYMCVYAWCTVSQTVFCMFDKIICNLFFLRPAQLVFLQKQQCLLYNEPPIFLISNEPY